MIWFKLTTLNKEDEKNQEETLLQTDVEPIPQEMLKKYILLARSKVS